MAVKKTVKPGRIVRDRGRGLLGFLFLFLVLSVPEFAWGEVHGEPGLSASLDVKSALLGDTAELTLTYRLPEGGLLPKDMTIGGLEGLTVIGREKEPGRIRIKLLVDRLETLTIGPFELSYRQPDGQTAFLAADPVSLEVTSVLGEAAQRAKLEPIQDIVPTRSVWMRYLPWVIGSLFLVVISGSIFLWWRRRRFVECMNAELLDPPHIQAGKALDRLESSGLFERGRVKSYYFRLSELLRRYVEIIRAFPAAEMTTEEIALHADLQEDRRLLQLFRQVDMVKYADYVPTSAEKKAHVQTAVAYIEATAPAEGETPSFGEPGQRCGFGGREASR